jgi:para-aminobenzoate synthetase component 1
VEITLKEVVTSLSAFDIYSLFKHKKDVIFLDSAKDPNRLGKYSFIGIEPYKKVTYKNGIVKVNAHSFRGDPFEVLKNQLETYATPNKQGELPFVGGCMGYFAYDLVRDMEDLPDDTRALVDLPTMIFIFHKHVIIYDHHHHKAYIATVHSDETEKLASSEATIEHIIKNGDPIVYKTFEEVPVVFESRFDEHYYSKAVNQMRSYIEAGDIYIANMTHTYTAKTQESAYDIYKNLRRINPAPFSAFMQFDGFEVLCSSPERFIQIVNGKVETRPIKGTRPRGKTASEDEFYRLELEHSEKDRSELLMVVDLERNDLSKVCRPYTVKVTELFNIESYATVHHLVATIVGELKSEATAVDCIKACFPGGSITGTPKIRAMEIIEELELTKRNLYTGCIGYFGFDGNADFNIIIRTLIKQGNQLMIGVGGGITWESDARSEYFETLDKAEALFRAVRMKEVSL